MIKKYITLAALLSAGTALANAATWEKVSGGDVTITTTFGNTAGNSDIGNITPNVAVSGGYSSNTVNISGLSSNIALWGDGRAANKYDSIVPKFDVTQNGDWNLGLTVNFGTLVGQVMQKYAFSTGGTPHTLRLDSVDLYLGAIKQDGAFVTSYNNNTYELKLTLSNSQGSWPKTVKDVKLSGGVPDVVNSGTGPQPNPFGFSFIPTAQMEDPLLLNSSTNFQFTVKQALASTSGSIGLQKIVFNTSVVKQVNDTPVNPPSPPVPEPSAFGLLAGLGALALVASRRRRK